MAAPTTVINPRTMGMTGSVSMIKPRAGVRAMGLEIYPVVPACGLTAVNIPSADRIGSKFVKHCEDRYGMIFAGGQAQLKGKIFRIAHMGYYDEMDVIKALASVEAALKDLGERDVLGAGVRAALEVFTLNEQ